jgi:hypothetical protein
MGGQGEPGATGPRGVGECLSIQARRDPDRPALSYGDLTLSRG